MENIFDRAVRDAHTARIKKLTPEKEALRRSMYVAQVLAHLSRPYEMICDQNYGATHKRSNGLVRFLRKRFLKPIVVGLKPYKRNSRTAREFVVSDERVLEVERKRLVARLPHPAARERSCKYYSSCVTVGCRSS